MDFRLRETKTELERSILFFSLLLTRDRRRMRVPSRWLLFLSWERVNARSWGLKPSAGGKTDELQTRTRTATPFKRPSGVINGSTKEKKRGRKKWNERWRQKWRERGGGRGSRTRRGTNESRDGVPRALWPAETPTQHQQRRPNRVG